MRHLLRTTVLAAALLGSAAALPATAQTVGYNIRTGDVWVDTRLGEIDRYGRAYREPFVDEITGYYGAPRSVVVDLLDRRDWAPADVYYACALARALGRNCADIVTEYERDGGRGWGVTAQRLGIKPGSPAFHALKRGTVATYDRWGHPITLTSTAPVRWNAPKAKPGKPAKAKAVAAPHGGHGDHGAHAAHARPSGKPAHAGHGKPAHAGHGKADKGPAGKGGNGNGKGGGNGKGRD